jgi:hypothetical protein
VQQRNPDQTGCQDDHGSHAKCGQQPWINRSSRKAEKRSPTGRGRLVAVATADQEL